jgi:hypothetical protein
MSLNRMILCVELKNGLCKLVTTSKAVTNFSVTKLRLHCTLIWQNLLLFFHCCQTFLLFCFQPRRVIATAGSIQVNFFLNQLSQTCCHTTIPKRDINFVLYSRYVPWIRSTVDYLEIDHTPRETERSRQDPESAKDDLEEPESEDKLNENGPCSSNPCGANTNCWNSGERFMCTCNQDKPHGNPYFGCSDCVYDTHCNPK